LRNGFKDHTGSYLCVGITLTGVFVSDRPLDCNEGARGDTILEIELETGETILEDFELVEEGKPYREWCVPAKILNGGRIRFRESVE
jgi:hypothetical protein